MSELLSCPLCGEKARIDRYEHFYRVLCTDCPASTEWLYSEQEAIDAWNTRVERTCEAIPRSMLSRNWLDWECSECGQNLDAAVNYCPNCGAKVVQ